jgi:hypothetical protein
LRPPDIDVVSVINRLAAKAATADAEVSPARAAMLELKARIGKSVLGQDHLLESMLIGLLANGNLLIESLPGLAKTRAVKTLAKNLAADLSRVTAPVACGRPMKALRKAIRISPRCALKVTARVARVRRTSACRNRSMAVLHAENAATQRAAGKR